VLNRREFLGTTIGAALAAGVLADDAMAVAQQPADAVVELRQYTTRSGKRDTLIGMFEESFQQPLNEVGAHVIGTFRDLDDPDRFVWMRGFRDMASRPQALSAFYDGPIWKDKRSAANATMLDSDNVLLLKPASLDGGFRPAKTNNGEIIGANIYYLANVDAQVFVKFFDEAMRPRLVELGAQPIARFVSEESPNNFPRLPVREHDRVFVWFARWPNLEAENAFATRFHALSGWRDNTPQALFPALMRKPERLRLAPTAKSELR
jgi:NIPSNAP protein